ncbi:hypothetical protein CPC08DRAFT_730920 [Agrocybe pediades]|nr:hypothetical protein CPC08DRAFT_730920 [Agrocybe pediades]
MTHECKTHGSWVWVFHGYGWGSAAKHPWMTHEVPYDNVPKDSYLAKFSAHCEHRLKHSHTPTDISKVTKELKKMQTLTRNQIFKKWKLYPTPSSYRCAMTWLSWAVKDLKPSYRAQSFYGTSHCVTWRCPEGHAVSLNAMDHPSVFFYFNEEDIQMVKNITSQRIISLDYYFGVYIPRISGGNYSNGTTPIHKLPLRRCTHKSCIEMMSPLDVTTSWPLTLTMVSDVCASTSVSRSSISYDDTFSIENGEGGLVEYKRVGRVIYSKESEHYTAQIQHADNAYTYDGMLQSGHRSSLCVKDIIEDIESARFDEDTQQQDKSRYNSVHDSESDTQKDGAELYDEDIPGQGLLRLPQAYEPDPFVSCTSCPLVGKPFELQLTCAGCSSKWHRECMKKSMVFEAVVLGWYCPECTHVPNGLWDQRMINRYVILKPSDKSRRFFPARVAGCSATTSVHVEWYSGNIYTKDELPKSRFMVITLEEAMRAEANTYFGKNTLGTVKWPVRLVEDAYDNEGYRNQAITNALEGAYPVVKLILDGKWNHPIVGLFDNWLSHPDRPKASSAKLAAQQSLFDFDFSLQFRLDILPGDASLIEPFYYCLSLELIRKKIKSQYPADHRNLLSGILFKVVIMRVYLGRNPCDDDQIFFLSASLSVLPEHDPSTQLDDPLSASKLGTLVRNKTVPELVMSKFQLTMPGHSLVKKVESTLEISLPKGTRLAKAQTDTGDVFLFQEIPGLEGLFSEDAVLSSAAKTLDQPAMTKPRPRPRPKPKKKNLEPAVSPSPKKNESQAEPSDQKSAAKSKTISKQGKRSKNRASIDEEDLRCSKRTKGSK